MPATFAHCLMAKKAVNILLNRPGGHPYVGILGENNQFVITGATGPDYPYLTNPVFSGELKSVHSWADRMHYENTDKFVRQGVVELSSMDKGSDDFKACLSWFLGYVSHVIADSCLHPVINCIVGGPYIFTHAEHAKCEMIQDVYIFRQLSEVDIVDADPRDDSHFGFLTILDECLENDGHFHHAVRNLWTNLLEFSHPQGNDHFHDIDPDVWHQNYRKRIGTDADPTWMFRHACGLVGVSTYKRIADVTAEEKSKYIDAIPVPNGSTSDYDHVFNKAVNDIIGTWEKLFKDIEVGTADNVLSYIKDWNLDIGVDESVITLWV